MQKPEGTARVRAVGDDVGLPDDITDFAVTIYEQALDAGFQPSGVRSYPAAIYGAARIREFPLKPKEIAAFVDDVEGDDVVREMNRMVDALPYNVDLEDPTTYIDRYVERLGASDQLLEAARSLADDAVDAGLHSGKSPSGFAAACVYAAAYMLDADYTQDDVADVANVSTVTIRNMYRDLIRLRGDVEPRIADGGDWHDSIKRAIGDIIDAFDVCPDVVEADAKDMVDDLNGADWLGNKNPRGVAAGLLYVAAKRNRVDLSQAELADEAGVHKETVLHRVKDIRGHFGTPGGD